MFALAFTLGFVVIMALLSRYSPPQRTLWADYQGSEYTRTYRVNGRYEKVEE